MKIKKGDQAFFNPPDNEGSGWGKYFIYYSAEGDKTPDFEASLTMADCYRRITLDFGTWWGVRGFTEKELKLGRDGLSEGLAKIDKVIDLLEGFRADYLEITEIAEAELDRLGKKLKKESKKAKEVESQDG